MADDEVPTFHWFDYVVWAVSVSLSLLIGMYVAYTRRHQNSLDEYLLGGRNMHAAAVGVSVMASFMNATLLVGGPVEMYIFGSIYALVGFAWIFSVLTSAFVFVPTFHKMTITSAYQYLEERFHSRSLRIVASAINAIYMFLIVGIFLYTPAMAFGQVTGLDLVLSIVFCGGVCVVYTVLGGVRAVVWVDVLQMAIMVCSMLILVIIGGLEAGSPSEIMDRAIEGGRMNFNKSALASIVISLTILTLAVCIGMVMYAYYYYCDPLTTGKVDKPDQLVPYFMMDVLGHLHGIPGLYTAALFAAGLSSVSSAINSLVSLFVIDFIAPAREYFNKDPMTSKRATMICKVLTLVFGLIAIGTAFLPAHLSSLIVQLPKAIGGGLMSSVLCVFTMGLFVPFAEIYGAYSGLITSLFLGLWLSIGGSLYGKDAVPLYLNNECLEDFTLYYNASEGSTVGEAFTFIFNATTESPSTSDARPLQDFYDISYAWYALYSVAAGLLVGVPVSFAIRSFKCSPAEDTDASLLYDYKGSSCCCKDQDVKDKNCLTTKDTSMDEKPVQETGIRESNLWTLSDGKLSKEKIVTRL